MNPKHESGAGSSVLHAVKGVWRTQEQEDVTAERNNKCKHTSPNLFLSTYAPCNFCQLLYPAEVSPDDGNVNVVWSDRWEKQGVRIDLISSSPRSPSQSKFVCCRNKFYLFWSMLTILAFSLTGGLPRPAMFPFFSVPESRGTVPLMLRCELTLQHMLCFVVHVPSDGSCSFKVDPASFLDWLTWISSPQARFKKAPPFFDFIFWKCDANWEDAETWVTLVQELWGWKERKK